MRTSPNFSDFLRAQNALTSTFLILLSYAKSKRNQCVVSNVYRYYGQMFCLFGGAVIFTYIPAKENAIKFWILGNIFYFAKFIL